MKQARFNKEDTYRMVDHQGTPVQSDRLAVNGTSLHFRFAGMGAPVVLLHGIPKTGYHWRHLLPLLSDQYTVIVPDLRGLGDSDHPADGYDSATMSDDIAALMAKLGHAAYSVVGEDWGAVIGYQSLVFAEALMPGFNFEQHSALTPENAAGMFLWHVGFYFKSDVPEMLIAGHERELITYMIKSERLFPDTATTDALEEYVRCYSLPGGIRSMLAVYRAMLVDGEQNRKSAKTKLELPVLALGGDAFIGARNESIMQQLAQNVTGHVFHAGHDLAEEVPEEMAAVILPFLAAHQ
jgi:pimeloyl-ACP methyl ester carboxylesterase